MPSGFPAGRWRGRWVWSERTAHAPAEPWGFHHSLDPSYVDRRVLLRRRFDCPSVPTTAPYRAVADSRYVLFLNGVEISRGPIRHGDRELYYDHGDAAAALRSGINVIAVVVRFFGTPNPWWMPPPTTESLGGGAFAMELRIGDNWVVTGEEWRCRDTDAWVPAPEAARGSVQMTEILDCRRLDPAWTTADYDDSDWPNARILRELGMGGSGDPRPPSDPYGPILPSPLPKPVSDVRAARRVAAAPALFAADTSDVTATLSRLDAPDRQATLPMQLEPGESRFVLADFGGVVAGHVRLRLSSDRGGDVVLGALTELHEPERFAYAGAFRYTTRAADQCYLREDPGGGRYLALAIRAHGTLQLDRVEVVERLRPRPVGAFFHCSDPVLDRIYEIGIRTVDLTAQDAYLDCPTREQRAWLGDSVVHQSVDLVTNPDWSLARWNPQLLAKPRGDGLLPMVGAGDFGIPDRITIPDWTLHWIRSVHNLYRYTGDHDLIAALLPIVEFALRWFTRFLGDDGLLHDVTGWVQIDWSPVPVTGVSASLNALWARALRDFVEMAHWQGDTGRAVWAATLRDRVRKGFEIFWDERRGAYREQILNGELRPAITEHAHAAAVCANLIPDKRRPLVRDLLLDRDRMFTRANFLTPAPPAVDQPAATHYLLSPNNTDWDTERLVLGAQPFYRYVVHDAVAQLGGADRIAILCRDWQRLLDTGPTAWREVWEGGSYAHGWSSTPTRDLITYTLGITPGKPGYETVRVAPRLGNLAWARGRVPIPHGGVTVSAHDRNVTIESPVPVEIVARDGNVTTHQPGSITARI